MSGDALDRAAVAGRATGCDAELRGCVAEQFVLDTEEPTAGVVTGTSQAFRIDPGTATHLIFTAQPVNTTAGAVITPAVEVTALDAGNNTATGFVGNVTVAIGTNPGGPSTTLSGTKVVAAVGGVASFSTLSINNTGNGYTLTATGVGPTATSAAFNITP